ncbi:MAG: amidohydrolase family protein [Acidimicrobiales bacterium]|nr:amidohydrolase family protein [Acidimicrobiales bacterium]
MADHQLVIRNGTVVDGSGAPALDADVAVDGGRITAVGHVPGSGATELDADGLLVTPGWVDIHTHYDGQVTWDPLLSPSCWHGVTTAVMGNCGVGFAPVKPDRHEWLIALMEGVEDIPGTALYEGIRWEWETFPEYLDAIDAHPHAIDVAAQIPHAALRGYVMGDRGADHAEVPDEAEIAEMGRLVAEAVRAGALGFSTSRTVNHRSVDGRHTPSLTATTAELVGIARAMGATGLGVFEVVADLVDLDAEFALFRSMVAESGRPMSVTTLQNDARPQDWQRLLGLIAGAAAEGLPMVGQVAARPVGLIMSLEGRRHPLHDAPSYAAVAHLPLAERVAQLRRPELREAICAELHDAQAMWGWDRQFPLGNPLVYDVDPARSLAGLGRAGGVHPAEVAYDHLISGDGTGTIYVPVMNFADGDLAATRAMLVDDHTVPGLGDAGAHCTMICDGSFPTYLLTYWGRDASADLRLPVEWIVKRQSRDTARAVGLHDRGVLAPGLRADLNLVDLDTLSIGAPEMLYDLPAGGKRLVQRTEGYRATVVAGEVVFRDGEHTGALPGALVRGAQSATA